MSEQMIREAVGVFHSRKNLDEAIAELEATRFPRHDISVLGSPEDIRKKFGESAVRPEWLEDNPDVPRGVSIRPEERAIGMGVIIGVPAYIGGCMAAVSSGITTSGDLLLAITTGSLLGAAFGGLAAFAIGRVLKDKSDRQIRKGGLLLWVRTPGPQREKMAKHIMKKYGGSHVHVHSVN